MTDNLRAASHGDMSNPRLARASRKDCSYTPHVGKGPRGVDELILNRQPTEWVVDLLGARGALVLIAGDSGAGKTSLLYQMANAISKGELFLGELNTVKSKVLIIQADESIKNALEKLELMDIDVGFDFLFGEDGWNTLDIDRIRKEIKKGGYGVLFLDSVTTLLTNRGTSMKDPEFARPLYDLNSLASELNILIVCNSHIRKPDGIRHEVTIHDVIGAGTQTAAVSDTWGLWSATKPEFESHYIFKCLGKRNCQEGTIWNLQGDEEDFSWYLKSVGKDDLLPKKKQELSDQVLLLLHNDHEWRTANEIALAIGSNPEHARRICKKLFLEEEIAREKKPSAGGRPLWLYGPKTFPT